MAWASGVRAAYQSAQWMGTSLRRLRLWRPLMSTSPSCDWSCSDLDNLMRDATKWWHQLTWNILKSFIVPDVGQCPWFHTMSFQSASGSEVVSGGWEWVSDQWLPTPLCSCWRYGWCGRGCAYSGVGPRECIDPLTVLLGFSCYGAWNDYGFTSWMTYSKTS